MIYIVANTKGGVGKSIVAYNVLPILIDNDNTKIIEIDNHNKTSESFKNDSNYGNFKTVKINRADDTLDDVFFEAIANKTDVICDLGGGDDSDTILRLLKNQPSENIKYIIPFGLGNDDVNAYETYKKINEPDKTLFVLNGYTDLDYLEEHFLFFFGNDEIEGIKNIIPKAKYITIPFSNLFNISRLVYGMTIKDLANKSAHYKNNDEAYNEFLEKSGGDVQLHKKMYKTFKNSKLAQKLVAEIKSNLKSIK